MTDISLGLSSSEVDYITKSLETPNIDENNPEFLESDFQRLSTCEPKNVGPNQGQDFPVQNSNHFVQLTGENTNTLGSSAYPVVIQKKQTVGEVLSSIQQTNTVTNTTAPEVMNVAEKVCIQDVTNVQFTPVQNIQGSLSDDVFQVPVQVLKDNATSPEMYVLSMTLEGNNNQETYVLTSEDKLEISHLSEPQRSSTPRFDESTAENLDMTILDGNMQVLQNLTENMNAPETEAEQTTTKDYEIQDFPSKNIEVRDKTSDIQNEDVSKGKDESHRKSNGGQNNEDKDSDRIGGLKTNNTSGGKEKVLENRKRFNQQKMVEVSTERKRPSVADWIASGSLSNEHDKKHNVTYCKNWVKEAIAFTGDGVGNDSFPLIAQNDSTEYFSAATSLNMSSVSKHVQKKKCTKTPQVEKYSNTSKKSNEETTNM